MNISPETALYGIIGTPLGHTLSPAVHNAAFKALEIDAVYLAFETADALTCLEAAKALPIKGLSITIPYKSFVLEYLDFIEPQAVEIGAVNTVVNRGGILHGHNTDAAAALQALENHTSLEGKHCLLLGAGGAARALGFALKNSCRSLTIANRTQAHAQELARSLGCRWLPFSETGSIGADIVINTTPVGMYPRTSEIPVTEQVLEHALVVMDIVYRPQRTAFLDLAERMGCITIDGGEMFMGQAAAQFRLWTGLQAPKIEMKEAFDSALKGMK